MKRLYLACAACLSLIVVSAYLLAIPVFAAGVTATCRNGNTISCTGTACQSADTFVGDGGVVSDGYCTCSGPGSSNDTHYCHDDDGPLIY
jgi:hypothetical protein